MRRADAVARVLGRLGRGVSLAARTVLPLDTNPVPAEWSHVTKVDPELDKKLPLCYPLYLQHTSAVSVGGSADVTAQNTEETFALLEPASVPVIHEPSGARHVTRRTRDAADLLAIPEVVNGDAESLVGTLGAGVEHIREELVPELLAENAGWLPASVRERLADLATWWLLSSAAFEAYVIQNPDSAAAREGNVTEADVLEPREAKRRAMAAERHLESEIVYLEYSGTYGGADAAAVLDAMSDGLTWSRLWYGGGLDSRERTEAMLDAGADAVVVGDAFHRVADEEARLCERAVEAVESGELDGDADTAAIREWIRAAICVEESNAAAYLATIPSVDDPEALALAYQTVTVRTWLGLTVRGDDSVLASLADVVDHVDDDARLAARVASAVPDDGCSDDELPMGHFALSDSQ